jgi:basic membrane protein A
MHLGIAAGTALALSALVAGAGPAAAQEPLKIGFVYVGPIGDFGWSYRHNQGRLAVEAALGDKVETTFVESVKEGPDAERVIQQLVDAGDTLIFTTSFGFMDATMAVAELNPEVKFEHATGIRRADNVATYAARFYEGRFVQGVIAAKMSKTGIGCYVGAYPIPEVVAGINAYTLGMRSVNPEAVVKIAWVNSWYDPGREADAANALLDQGCDVITQHTDSPAPLQTAANRGVPGFGQASDMIQFAPTAQLTAIIDNWDKYYVARAQAVLDGTWTSTDTWGGLDVGMVEMAAYTNMPDDVKALAEETEAKLIDHSLHAFAGPIRDQGGMERVAAGAHADDGMILSMDWFVEGVDGSLPQ